MRCTRPWKLKCQGAQNAKLRKLFRLEELLPYQKLSESAFFRFLIEMARFFWEGMCIGATVDCLLLSVILSEDRAKKGELTNWMKNMIRGREVRSSGEKRRREGEGEQRTAEKNGPSAQALTAAVRARRPLAGAHRTCRIPSTCRGAKRSAREGAGERGEDTTNKKTDRETSTGVSLYAPGTLPEAAASEERERRRWPSSRFSRQRMVSLAK